MPVSSMFKFLDSLYECCYVVSDILGFHEVLNFWFCQVSFIRHLYENLKHLPDESVNRDKISRNCENFVFQKCRLSSHSMPSSSKKEKQTPSILERKSSFQFRTPFNENKFETLSNENLFKTPFGENDHKTSTPTKFNIYTSKQVVDLQCRVSYMEQEINELKKQIKTLSQSDVTKDKNSSHHKIPEIIIETSSECCFPPPPPPPPPLPPISAKRSPFKFKKKKNSTTILKTQNALPEQLDMTLILKGLKDVKLKRTDRSPGGTPMRKVKPLSNDPVNILQEALKRRFNGIHPVEFNNKENLDDSWDRKEPSFLDA